MNDLFFKLQQVFRIRGIVFSFSEVFARKILDTIYTFPFRNRPKMTNFTVDPSKYLDAKVPFVLL